MKSNDSLNPARRQFLGTIASGVAALGLSSIVSPLSAQTNNFPGNPGDPDEWFKQIKGKHRIVFDVPQANEIFPFAWPRIFLATNAATRHTGKRLQYSSSAKAPGHSLCNGRSLVGKI